MRISRYIELLEGAKKLYTYKLLNSDVKPDNIMISESGMLKYIDLGMLDSLNGTVIFAGTLPFFSPAKAMIV